MGALPGIGGITGAGARRIAFRASATAGSTVTTIVIPSGAVVGDLGVLVEYGRIGPPPSAIPSGWTAIYNTALGNMRVALSWKKLTSGDPGATITGLNGVTGSGKVMFVFDVSSFSTVTGAATANATEDNPTLETVPGAGKAVPHIIIGMSASTSAGFNASTGTFDATVTGGRVVAGYKIVDGVPANFDVDMDDGGVGNAVLGAYIIPQ